MPIYSESHHNRAIGLHYQHSMNLKNKSSINKNQTIENNDLLREGKNIQGIILAKNSHFPVWPDHRITDKKIKLLMWFNVTLLITSIKPPSRFISPPELPMAPHRSGALQDKFHSLGLGEAMASQSAVNLFTLPGTHIRAKRATTCTCEAPEKSKAKKRAKAQRAEEKRVRAREKTTARAAIRAAVRAESAGSTVNLVGSATGTATGMAGKILITGGSIGIGLGAGLGAGIATSNRDTVAAPAGKVSQGHPAQRPQVPAEKETNRAAAISGNTNNEERLIQSEINRMDAFYRQNTPQSVDENANVQSVDISHIPRLTKFIHPMNFYRWLFKHEKTDQFMAIKQSIINHYRTDNVYIHRLGDPEENIPIQFSYLKNSIGTLKTEINKAQNLLNQALHEFQHTTIRNDFDILQYPPNNSIKKYFKGALGTNDESILYEAMVRFEYYLLQLNVFFHHHKDNIIFATSKREGVEYIHNPDCPTGFVMPMDSGNRIVIMADIFANNMVLNNRLHITALHEATHIQAGSRDFIYSPITRLVGDASEILEVFNEAIYTNGNEAISCDELFLQCYENFLDISISKEQFIQLIKTDTMLQKNIMMDNADSIAQYIADIAQSRAYDHDYHRRRRNGKQFEKANSPYLQRSIFKLLIKHSGLA